MALAKARMNTSLYIFIGTYIHMCRVEKEGYLKKSKVAIAIIKGRYE